MATCTECGHSLRRTMRRAISEACANPARCWRWDHTCYARRMRAAGKRTAALSVGYTPAMIRGQVVPQTQLAA